MNARRFVPDRGDIVWIDTQPQAGHEQSGRRPALVLSPAAYNDKASLALLCPITSQVKGYPFEVALPPRAKVSGVVLADQVRSLDWRARSATSAGRASAEVVTDVLAKLAVLLEDR